MGWSTPATVIAGQLMTAAFWNTQVRDNEIELRASSWPIGSIFIARVATNPATLLGFGTWEAYGTGRTLVAIDGGQTEFDAIDKTGGTKTVALSSAEMVPHTHSVPSLSIPGMSTGIDSSPDSGFNEGDYSVRHAARGRSDGGHTHDIPAATYGTGAGTSGALSGTGAATAHNNLSPYIVVYMWKRTA